VNLKTTTKLRTDARSRRGFLTTDLLVAMTILAIAVVPLAYSFLHDARLMRASYRRAVGIEIVDSELEILAAGEWRAFPEGTNSYPVYLAAARNLPPGHFQFTRLGRHLSLEWIPSERTGVGTILRETTLK
jgi:hypothetical protein